MTTTMWLHVMAQVGACTTCRLHLEPRQVAYQLSWLLLLMYGLPSWFDSYKHVDRCAFFSDGTLNSLAGTRLPQACTHSPVHRAATLPATDGSLCCSSVLTGAWPPCDEAQGGLYAPHEVPLCWIWRGGCRVQVLAAVAVERPMQWLQEPAACVDASSCARVEVLQHWYNAAEGSYRDAQALRQMKTDSALFNTLIFCQVADVYRVTHLCMHIDRRKVFNMVNARKPHGEVNVLHGLHRSWVFLVVCVVVFVGQVRGVGYRANHKCNQVLIMQTALGRVFGVLPQTARQWTYAALVGAGGVVVRAAVVGVGGVAWWTSPTHGRRRRGSVLPVGETEGLAPLVATPPVAFRRVR